MTPMRIRTDERWCLAAAVVGSVSLCGSHAHAQVQGTWGDTSGTTLSFVAPGTFDLVIGVPPLIANSVYIHRHEHRLVWPLIGIIGGAALLVFSGAYIFPNAVSNEYVPPAYNWGMWIGTAALGVVDIVLGAVVLSIPRRHHHYVQRGEHPFQWSVTPLAARDASGQQVVGAAFTAVNF